MAKIEQVLPFKPAAVTGSFPPVAELVEELEKLLARAKTGELRGLVWAGVCHDGVTPDADILSGWCGGPYTKWGMCAAISRMQHRWNVETWNGEA